MAILKDSIVQGSMRITDTLYTDNINTNLLSADELISPLLSLKTTVNSATSTTEGINLYTNNSIVGHIGTSNAVGIYSTGSIYLRPGNGTISSSYGATLSHEYFQPVTSLASQLGTSNSRWNGVYSSTGNFSDAVTVSTLTISHSNSAVSHITFSREGVNYLIFPDHTNASLGIGYGSAAAANCPLMVDKTSVRPGAAALFGTINLGSSTIAWGSLYSKSPTYIYSGNSQMCLDTYIYNKSKNQVAEIYYNSGNADNVTSGQFSFRQFSPKATADTGTTGFHETYSLPTVASGLTGNQTYNILTTKSTLTVAQGGTGVTSFTNDCVVVSTGTTQTLVSRGLKVTGAAGADITLSPDTAGKTMTISSTTGAMTISTTTGAMTIGSTGGNANTTITSGGTLLLNRASGASIIFEQNNTEIARFNQKNSFLIGDSASNQDTYKLYVNGNIGTTGKIAFNTNVTTEKASVQYINSGLFYRGTVITGTGVAAGGNSTNGYTGARWVFNLGIDVPTNGDRITIKVPIISHDQGTYISTDNGTTFRPVGINGGTTRLAGQYPANSIVTLVYDSDGTINSLYPPTTAATARANSNTTTIPGKGCWRVVNYYDSGFNEWNLRQYTLKAVNAVTSGHIIGGTDSGYSNIDSGVAFDIRYAVLYAGSNLSAGSTGSNNFIHHYSINIKNSSGTNITLTTYKNVYIKGTISGHLFTPITGGSPYVSDITATDDGYVYYYIGRCYSSNNAFTFDATGKSIYWYKNGAIQPYNALSNVSNDANLNSANGTIGDIIYWSAANTPARLAKGDAGKFLKMGNNNVPVWGEGSEVTLNGTATTTPSFYAPTGAGSNGQFLKTTGSGAPSWVNLPTASTTSAGIIQIGTGSLNAAAGDHTHDYLPLIGGTVSGQITTSAVVGGATEIASTHCGALYINTATSAASGAYYQSFLGCKTSSGAWSIAAASAANDLYFIYGTDANHTNSTNTVGKIKFGYDGKVYNAVWNDYAEYRKQFYEIEPGRVIKDTDYGYVVLADERLIPGAQVVSDTFGFAIGQAADSKTPVAVSGRALVYTYQDRGKYHAGDAVCSAPNGTVDLMTREEIQKYPDAIIGIVSEIPNYTIWGAENIPVNGRIWIKVR